MRLALASSPDDTRRSALERAEAEPSATGDDDESDPEWDAAAANYDESVRRGLVAPPPKRPKHERVIGQRPRDEPALVSALKRCYALDSPGASAAYPHASHAEIVRLLRRCEQFEIALQGDDYSDKTEPHFNAEASQYAKVAATVASLDWSLAESLETRGKEPTRQRLLFEPWVGEFRAGQVIDLATTGTTTVLEAFEAGRCPLGSDGLVRLRSGNDRPLDGGAAKLAMSKVVSISAKRAYELYHCTGLVGDRLGFAVKSLDELKALSTEQLRDINPIGEGRMLRWLLDHHDELQQPVPEAEAIAMLDAVRRVVRAQHSQRSGRRRDCQRLPGVPLCRCCWHVEFVGGGRRRGRPGHDADLLVWHREETNSWGDDRHHDNVLRPLTRALEAEDRIVPVWEMHVLERHAYKQEVPGKGLRGYLARPEARGMADATGGLPRGAENLKMDHHDKVFTIWKSATTGCHHRIDIVVVAHPEELAFARLAWTGSRVLNRMMRLRALSLGLSLSAHALVCTGDKAEADGKTTVVLRVFEHNGERQVETVRLAAGEVVPYRLVSTEMAIIRVLAEGTDDFTHLNRPTNRNA